MSTRAIPTATPVADTVTTRRLSLNLSDSVYSELASLAKERRSSMTEIVRLALGLVRIAIQAAKKGQRLVVTTDDGQPVKEIVLP